jgi:glycosyltransferase involved in cell wall biosynthesis
VALERHNAAVLAEHLREHSPDLVSWWAMGGMSLSLIERVRRSGLPALGVVGDDWMVYGPRVDRWSRLVRRRGRTGRFAERMTGIPGQIRLDAAGEWLFNSRATRNRALAAVGWLPRARVAHPGVAPELFRPAKRPPWRWRLLYVGRLDERKGLETAVRALAMLPRSATLDVLGSGDDRYAERLRGIAMTLGLAGRITFTTRPRSELPAAYADADAVLFPVLWEEPWGLVPLEAMAVGAPVVATGTGGSREYMRASENCLIFEPKDDPEALATAVSRLAHDEELRERLRQGGVLTASRFTEESYDRAIAEAIERLASGDVPASEAA